ncbi:MAG TPA: hypothetical protein VG754_12065 [Verrucomicrobiae bacterium]|nr:hypothetical protein [Verrucomicrobiae bacterium]
MKMFLFTRGFKFCKPLFCICAALLLATSARAQNLRVEAKLVWGTDDQHSPNPKHHLLDPVLTKRLKGSPYRWKNYFEECQRVVEIPVGQTKSKIVMSDRCTLDIKNLGGDCVEVRLHGNGKPVSMHKESLKSNGLLVLGGEAPNETAWLVTIRKAAPAPTASK